MQMCLALANIRISKLEHSSTNLQDIIDWFLNVCNVPNDPDKVFCSGL
jgi:hypothetical protein